MKDLCRFCRRRFYTAELESLYDDEPDLAWKKAPRHYIQGMMGMYLCPGSGRPLVWDVADITGDDIPWEEKA